MKAMMMEDVGKWEIAELGISARSLETLSLKVEEMGLSFNDVVIDVPKGMAQPITKLIRVIDKHDELSKEKDALLDQVVGTLEKNRWSFRDISFVTDRSYSAIQKISKRCKNGGKPNKTPDTAAR